MNVVLALIMLVISVVSAQAHGVSSTAIDSDSVVAVQLSYSSGEPMTKASVNVFSPSSPDVAVLAGFTDRNGKFAFVPDEDGEWLVEASDGMGHLSHVDVHYSHDGGAEYDSQSGSSGSSLYMRILFGLSLIANIFMAYSLLRNRKTHAHQ